MVNKIAFCSCLGISMCAVGFCSGIQQEIPFEVVVCSQRYRLVRVEQEPVSKEVLKSSEVVKAYAPICKNPLKKIDWGAMEKVYPTFVGCKMEGAVLTFTFDYLRYFQQFDFDSKRLTEAFSKGTVPFIHEYVWQCELSSILSKCEMLTYRIIFDRFRGGNLVLATSESEGVVKCVPQENFPGQVLLEDSLRVS